MIEGTYPAGRVDPIGVAPAEVVAQALRCELLEAVAEAAVQRLGEIEALDLTLGDTLEAMREVAAELREGLALGGVREAPDRMPGTAGSTAEQNPGGWGESVLEHYARDPEGALAEAEVVRLRSDLERARIALGTLCPLCTEEQITAWVRAMCGES